MYCSVDRETLLGDSLDLIGVNVSRGSIDDYHKGICELPENTGREVRDPPLKV